MQRSISVRQTGSAMASDRPGFAGGGLDLVDDVLDPRAVEHLGAVGLDAGGGVHVALALGQQRHQGPVQGVHALADIGHGLAVAGNQSFTDLDNRLDHLAFRCPRRCPW
jgi:hypothetical protein